MSKVEELQALIPQLPESAVDELLQRAREFQTTNGEPEVVPVKLGGLWMGIDISDEDIREMRREAWAGFGERRDLD